MIKAIWFDIDNTLLDFDAYVRESLQKGLLDFEHLSICERVGISKPTKEFFGHGLSVLGLAPDEVLMIAPIALAIAKRLNISPVGASANITGIGILRKEGYEVKNSDFLKIGIPFTLAAVIPAYIYFLIFYY